MAKRGSASRVPQHSHHVSLGDMEGLLQEERCICGGDMQGGWFRAFGISIIGTFVRKINHGKSRPTVQDG